MTQGITTYSDKIAGTPRNYNWPVRFDMTDGCLGITQYEGNEVKDRVLLSPEQTNQLRLFLDKKTNRQS